MQNVHPMSQYRTLAVCVLFFKLIVMGGGRGSGSIPIDFLYHLLLLSWIT